MESRSNQSQWFKNTNNGVMLPPPSVVNSMLPPPPKICREKEKDWDDSMSVATSGGLPALSVYEAEEEEFRRQAILEGKIPSEFELSYKCTYCAICSSKSSTVKEGLEHFRKKHYKKRCPKCFMVFSSTGNVFKDHLTTHFVASKSRLEHIQCVYCVDKIYHYEDLWDHLENEHLSNLNKEKTSIANDGDNVIEDLSPVTEETFCPLIEKPQCSDLPQPPHQFVDASFFDNVTLFTQDNVLELCLGNNVGAPIGSRRNTLISSSSYPDSDSETIDFPIQGRKGFSDDQKRHLIRSFLEDPNPPWDPRAKYLSHYLKCDNSHKISTWFTSERHKFVKGNLPMWAKSPSGMPAYKGHLLPNGKLQIMSMQGRGATPPCDDRFTNRTNESIPENIELLKPAGVVVMSNDSRASAIDSSSNKGPDNMFVCGIQRKCSDSEKLTEVVKIKIENDISRGSEYSSGYESDESCVTKIIPSSKTIPDTNNKERRVSTSREADTRTQIDDESTKNLQNLVTMHIKVEKDEISKTQNVTTSQNNIASCVSGSVKIKEEKGDGGRSSCGYESDDSCVTRVFLPERAKMVAAFNKWRASHSQQSNINGQTKADSSTSKIISAADQKSRENTLSKVKTNNQESIEVGFKQPANVTATGGNQRKQLVSEIRNEQGVQKQGGEATDNANIQHQCTTEIKENTHRKSIDDKSEIRSNVSKTFKPNPPFEKGGNDNSFNKKRLYNNENSESVEKETLKKRKLNSNIVGTTPIKTHQDQIQENYEKINKNSVNGPRKNENSNASFKFKIPKLPHEANKAKKAKNFQLKSDSTKFIPRFQNNSSKSAGRELCKPNILHPPEMSYGKSSPPVVSQSPERERLASNCTISMSTNSGISWGDQPETNSIIKPVVQRHRNGNNKMVGIPGNSVLNQPPKRRRRRCGTPIGQRLAPAVTTQQLKQSLKQREEKARNERQEKLRQEEIKKRKEEMQKQLELKEKKDKWELQRLKFLSNKTVDD